MKDEDEDDGDEDARHSCAYGCMPSSVLSVFCKSVYFILKENKGKEEDSTITFQ